MWDSLYPYFSYLSDSIQIFYVVWDKSLTQKARTSRLQEILGDLGSWQAYSLGTDRHSMFDSWETILVTYNFIVILKLSSSVAHWGRQDGGGDAGWARKLSMARWTHFWLFLRPLLHGQVANASCVENLETFATEKGLLLDISSNALTTPSTSFKHAEWLDGRALYWRREAPTTARIRHDELLFEKYLVMTELARSWLLLFDIQDAKKFSFTPEMLSSRCLIHVAYSGVGLPASPVLWEVDCRSVIS